MFKYNILKVNWEYFLPTYKCDFPSQLYKSILSNAFFFSASKLNSMK